MGHLEEVTAEPVETQAYEDGKDSQPTDVGTPHQWINNLSPPTGTSYHSRQSVTFLNNAVIGGGTKYGTVTWKADVYIYATGARPNDADFSERGLLNIIFLHSGYVTMYDNWSADLWKSLEFLVSVGNSNLVASLQLPQTESGAQDGDNYKYEIDYGEKMPMFKNNGNEAFDFDATFQQKFTRAASKQTGSSVKDTEFKILHTNNSSEHRKTEIYAFSKFTHKTPSAFPLLIGRKFTFRANNGAAWAIGGNIYLHLRF